MKEEKEMITRFNRRSLFGLVVGALVPVPVAPKKQIDQTKWIVVFRDGQYVFNPDYPLTAQQKRIAIIHEEGHRQFTQFAHQRREQRLWNIPGGVHDEICRPLFDYSPTFDQYGCERKIFNIMNFAAKEEILKKRLA